MTALCLLLAAQSAHAAYLFDVGKPDSAVRPGFQQVLVTTKYSAQAGFGWEATEGLEAQAQAFSAPAGEQGEPPPIFTNELTEDAILSAKPARFLVNVPAGDYRVHVICGVSSQMSNQVWDFTVKAGDQSRHVQIEGGQRFEWVELPVTVGPEPLAVSFTPASKWCVTGIIVIPKQEEATAGPQIIAPLRQEIQLLPPAEWAKWKEDPHVDNRPWPPISPADSRRGYLIHERSYLEPIYANTVPLAHTLNPELRAFASLGEYEPLNFIIWPLRELHGVKVTVSDLRQGNAAIPASAIDVRHVPFVLCRPNYTLRGVYRRNPDYLLHFDALDLPASENHRFWLTVHVPDNAQPGLYQGQVTFAAQGAPSAAIPIRFRVLRIRLQEDPVKIYGIYYVHPLDRAASAADDVSRAYFERKAELEHQDMVAHGTRNVVLSVWSPAADKEGKFKFNFDGLAKKIALGEKYGFKPPLALEFPVGEIYRKYTGQSVGNHLGGLKPPPPEFAAEVTAAVAEIERERKARGWPEFLYYPIDEPGNDPASVAFMVTVLKACRAVPGVRTYVTADPTNEGFSPLRPFVDVWCTQPFDPDRETVLADTKARGVEYWCYPNHVNGENDHTPVAGARMTYGFGFWHSGFRTLIPWIYQYVIGDPWNYLDGSASDFFNRSEADGTPIPVAMWEACREGYDDYRYVYTLTQLIDRARRAGKTKQADEAQAQLDSVWNAIRVQSKYQYTGLWGYDDFDAYRWVIAQEIMKLE